MTTLNRSDAQQRADAIGVFNSELQRLEDEQVLQLSEPQRSRLQAHQQALLTQYRAAFDIDQNNQARQLSLGMRIASFLGALALAASVFFLFYQFWGLFGEVAQVAILISASLLSLGLTLAVQQRDSSGYFSKLAALVAFACFVLNIVMLGQIFNITPSDKALLPWAAYACCWPTPPRRGGCWPRGLFACWALSPHGSAPGAGCTGWALASARKTSFPLPC